MDGVEKVGELTAATVMLQPIAKEAAALLTRLLGSAADEMAGLLADKVYGWRCMNRVKIFGAAQERLRSSGVDPDVLPKGFLVPFLEKAGDVEDPTLQEMWARLLAAAAEDSGNAQQMFTDVLSRLSPGDASFLRGLAGQLRSARDPLQLNGTSPLVIHGVRTRKPPDKVAAVGRLAALGIVEFTPQYRLSGRPLNNERLNPSSMQVNRTGSVDTFFELSPFGRQLLDIVVPSGHSQSGPG